MTTRVLLIDDEQAIRDSLGQAIELAGYEVQALHAAEAVPAVLDGGFHGIVITDLRLPGQDGMRVLGMVLEKAPSLPVVLMTGHGDVRTAVEAMRAGAFDFIEKPFRPEAVVNVLRHAERILMARRPGEPPVEVAQGGAANGQEQADALAARIRGSSAVMHELRTRVGRFAGLNADVLITGETGTGKEVVARALHDFGSRASAPFVAINCGAMAPELVGSELFGHEQGAFTGARERRIGKFEFAHGGTVFLDEIESMPMAMQAELLRVLQERRFTRLGGNREITVDVRVLAAAKIDLQALAEQGRFREDLFYRLNVLRLEIPPLRERGEDAAELFAAFVASEAGRQGTVAAEIDDSLARSLIQREWPGNVRELQNTALRYVLDHEAFDDARSSVTANESLRAGVAPEPLAAGNIPVNATGVASGANPPNDAPGPEPLLSQAAGANGSLADRVAAFEAVLVQQALDRHGGDLAATEQELKISRRTLHEKIRRYGLIRKR